MNNNTVSYLRPVVSKDGPINVLSENFTKHDEKEANEQEINQTNIEIKNTQIKTKKSDRYQSSVAVQKKKSIAIKDLDQSDDFTTKKDTSVKKKSQKYSKKGAKAERKHSKSPSKAKGSIKGYLDALADQEANLISMNSL